MTEYSVKNLEEAVFNLNEKKLIRVLHVDDEPNLLKIAKQFLEMEGHFQVETAASAEEALEKIKKESYDAVVSDYFMPGKNGLEFLQELRQNGNTIPFIILTGRGMEEVAGKALNLGADHYVNKQASPEMMFSELAHDIHKAVERKRAYLAAWLRQERLRAIFDSSPNAIMIIDLNGDVVECNQETLHVMKVSSKEKVIGKNALEFVEKRHRQLVSDNLKKALEQSAVKNVEFALLTESGAECVGELSASVVKDSSGIPTSIVALVSDITERKRAENTLRQYSRRFEENQRFLEYVFTASPDAITVCDLDGNIIKCNPATLDLHGCSSKNELIGADLFALFAQTDRGNAIGKLRKATVSEPIRNVEYRMLGRDGNEFPAELSAGAIRDSLGNPLGLVVIAKNVTERKRLQEQLIVSEKLAAVGQLAGAFSHDIRNPLAVIKNSICFLRMRLKETLDEKVTRHLNILEEEISYTNLMVNDLLDFTRKNPPSLRETNLNQVLKNTISSIFVPRNIRVVFRVGKIPLMLVDEAQLQRVFTNMILNAIQAMPNGGKLTAQTSRHNDFAEITFKDTGAGIPKENLQKMFSPFFSTKANGVGLGLSISKQIVDGHGGNITVKSREGAGSTFTIRLPICTKELCGESTLAEISAKKNEKPTRNRSVLAYHVEVN
jgi:two-component system NtrC family sensor kinase